MRVSINLASRPFADLAPALKNLRLAIAGLAVLAVVLAVGLQAVHQKAEKARETERAFDAHIAQVRQEHQGYVNLMHQPDNAQTLSQAEALNRLFDEKAFSWTLAMEDLETVLPAGVQVTTIEPTRAKDGHITLRLRVVGPRDRAVALVQNLEHSRHFLMPRIVGENSETAGRPGEAPEAVSASNRVDFDLLAEYNPSTVAERREAKAKAAEKASGSHPAEPTNTPTAPRPRSPLQPRRGGPTQ